MQKHLGQLLLGAAVVVAHVAERDQQAQVHAQQLLVAAPVDLLGQPRQQDHRSRGALRRSAILKFIAPKHCTTLVTIVM
jgi:hypothetical protein